MNWVAAEWGTVYLAYDTRLGRQGGAETLAVTVQ
jgi:hypothetical protein